MIWIGDIVEPCSRAMKNLTFALSVPCSRAPNADRAVATFFVLRTPLLPISSFANDMRVLVQRPDVREALFVASPSFDRALEDWLARGAPEDDDVPLTLVRYLARMATRPTPFGLFAGCSVGRIGAETRLSLGPIQTYRRHTRLDASYLWLLAEGLVREPEVRKHLRFEPSSGLYEAAGKIRHAEGVTRSESREREYELVAITKTPYLEATLARAARGARPRELAEALVADDPEIEIDEAEAFVASLAASQILTSSVSPTVTGPEPIGTVIDALRDTGAAAAHVLEEARDAMRAIDAQPPGVPTTRYHAIAKRLASLPADADIAKLFQVDLFKPGADAVLGGAGARAVEEAISLTTRLGVAWPHDDMHRFCEAFAARYGAEQPGPLATRRMVPLCEALDDETGIGFGDARGRAPLLEDLPFPSLAAERGPAFGKREARLLRGVLEAARSGAIEWRLSDADLEALSPAISPTLPDSFAFMGTLAGSSADDVRVFVETLGGPSAALLLGRFCHGDPELHRALASLVEEEERLRPDAVFAEIVHVPEGRLGNILSRPTLRNYEIPYLGRASVAPERQIPITDLYLVLDEGRIVLFSKRLGREVVPRLSSAHNHASSRFAIYRFLCVLQNDRERWSFGWDWGTLGAAPMLPRVSRGNVVLSLARWVLDKEELAPLAKAKRPERVRIVEALRARRGLPRWIVLADGDRALPVDLDRETSVASFAAHVARREAAVFTELYPAEDALLAESPEGRFTHQVVIPFVRRPASVPAPRDVGSPAPTTRRAYGPGSDWLCLRMETGTASADHVLTELVGPFVRATRRRGTIASWFFERRDEPAWHVRVVLRGAATRLAGLLPRFEKRAAPFVADGRVQRISLEPYDREIERWGGDAAVEVAEALFEADSDTVLDALEVDAERWHLALRGSHDLLVDLGLDPAARLEVVTRAALRLSRDLRVDKALEHALGTRFRETRRALEVLLAAEPGVFAARSARVRSLASAGGLRDQAAELIRVHCARMLRSDLDEQRFVILELLRRLYVSAEARRTPPSTSAST